MVTKGRTSVIHLDEICARERRYDLLKEAERNRLFRGAMPLSGHRRSGVRRGIGRTLIRAGSALSGDGQETVA